MTCPTCKTYICYGCRSEITKDIGYKHFCQTPHCQHKRCYKCPLYSNAEEDDARASREAGLKAVQSLEGITPGEAVEKLKSILNEEGKQSEGKKRSGPRNTQADHVAAARVEAVATAARQGQPRIDPNGAIQAMEAANQALQNAIYRMQRPNNPGYLNGVVPNPPIAAHQRAIAAHQRAREIRNLNRVVPVPNPPPAARGRVRGNRKSR